MTITFTVCSTTDYSVSEGENVDLSYCLIESDESIPTYRKSLSQQKFHIVHQMSERIVDKCDEKTLTSNVSIK